MDDASEQFESGHRNTAREKNGGDLCRISSHMLTSHKFMVAYGLPHTYISLAVSSVTEARPVLHHVNQTNQTSSHYYRVFRTEITGSSFRP